MNREVFNCLIFTFSKLYNLMLVGFRSFELDNAGDRFQEISRNGQKKKIVLESGL